METITLHPSYVARDLLGTDVAVLRLKQAVQYSDKVKPVCLPSDPEETHDNQEAMAAGFGHSPGHQGVQRLSEANVTILSNENCWALIKDAAMDRVKEFHLEDEVTAEELESSLETKICTEGELTSGTNTRNGDSGSSLNFFDEEHGRLMQQQFRYLIYLLLCRYATVGVLSLALRDHLPSQWARMTGDLKMWIKSIATEAQDSDCGQN